MPQKDKKTNFVDKIAAQPVPIAVIKSHFMRNEFLK